MKYEVRVFKVEGDTPVKAHASVKIGEDFVVTGFKVIEGNRGLFVALPSRKTKDGKFRDTAYPTTPEAREELFAAILEAYEQA